MSSEKSPTLQTSVISMDDGRAYTLNQHKSEQWEINLIGNFLLTLYHRCVIGPKNEWTCKEVDCQREFEKFVTPELSKRLIDVNGTDNICTLLQRCGFLNDAKSGGSPLCQLKSGELLEFRKKKLKQQDKCRINFDVDSAPGGIEDILNNLTERQKIPALQVKHEIDDDYPVYPLTYEGTTLQQRRPNYHPTNMSCFICQLDFSTMDSYEEHVQIHNDDKEFEYLKELSRFDKPIFSLSYRLCKNSHHFCFTIESHEISNIIIEKIIIVQSRSMFYVHNMRVPYDMPENGIENFYVDSHLFEMFVEQAIVLISHVKDNKDTRYIEEHHFRRSLEFPKVQFAITPQKLPLKYFKTKSKLSQNYPPLEIRNVLKYNFSCENYIQVSKGFSDYIQSGKQLEPQTMGPALTSLLYLEDIDSIKQYLYLIQRNVKLRSFGDDYSIRLRPKHSEYIENVLTTFDDVIITTRKNMNANLESLEKFIFLNKGDLEMWDTQLGQIENINSGRVSFRCPKRLDLHCKYTIIFRPSRLPLRYQYRAMQILPQRMQFLEKFLFPRDLALKMPSTLSLELYNKTIYNNPEQLQAVRNIAEGPRNDATYIIFGPPGTGKTTTLVESILQVLKRQDTKILVTASSNSACDEVALRLCKALATIDMCRAIVRIYAQSNEARIETIDDLLLEHSNMCDYVQFYPDVEVLHQYRIVVCTMSVVAKLSTGKFGIRSNDGMIYTHLFIDEVAASTEAEALMAITSVLSSKSCLIIAGDHKQLGPILTSKRAEEFNLGVSLMDRLLARECYSVNADTGDYDRTIQSRLRLNFRSHPAIVNLYSGLYYNYELEAKANIDDVSLVKYWHLAPNKNYPIIFHTIDGTTNCDFFSFYNSDEVNIVMDYVKDLMYFGINGKPVRECDIGVISPYKRQYQRIREQLNLRKWYQIETGSVEVFQGQEKKIIIVSFVRSRTPTLGFLENPRRLNVTLSRAKSLLILIGNASTLSMNPDFDYIVKECKRHHTFIGGLDNSNNNLKIDRKGDYKLGLSNHMATKMDMVNRKLNSLPKRRSRGKRGGKSKISSISNKGKENSKPTISVNVAKSNLSQTMKAGNRSQNREIERKPMSFRGKDQNTIPANKISPTNVMPNVTKNSTTTVPVTSKTQQNRQLQLQAIIHKLNSQLLKPANTNVNNGPAVSPSNASEKTKIDQKSNIDNTKKNVNISSKSKKALRRQYFVAIEQKTKDKRGNANNTTSKSTTNAGQFVKSNKQTQKVFTNTNLTQNSNNANKRKDPATDPPRTSTSKEAPRKVHQLPPAKEHKQSKEMSTNSSNYLPKIATTVKNPPIRNNQTQKVVTNVTQSINNANKRKKVTPRKVHQLPPTKEHKQSKEMSTNSSNYLPKIATTVKNPPVRNNQTQKVVTNVTQSINNANKRKKVTPRKVHQLPPAKEHKQKEMSTNSSNYSPKIATTIKNPPVRNNQTQNVVTNTNSTQNIKKVNMTKNPTTHPSLTSTSKVAPHKVHPQPPTKLPKEISTNTSNELSKIAAIVQKQPVRSKESAPLNSNQQK